MKRWHLLLFILAGIAVPASGRAEPAPVTYRFAQGDVWAFKTEGAVTMTTEIGAVSRERRIALDHRTLLFILAVAEDGSARAALLERPETGGHASVRFAMGKLLATGFWTVSPSARADTFRLSPGLLAVAPLRLPEDGVAPGMDAEAAFALGPLVPAPTEPLMTRWKTGEKEVGLVEFRTDLSGTHPGLVGRMGKAGVFDLSLNAGSAVEVRFDRARGRVCSWHAATHFELVASNVKTVGNGELTVRCLDFPADEAKGIAVSACLERALDCHASGNEPGWAQSLRQAADAAKASPWADLIEALEKRMAPPAAGTAPDPEKPSGLQPSRVSFDEKDVTPLQILSILRKQTGNLVKIEGDRVENGTIPRFQASREPFWSVLARLEEASGNAYGQEAFEPSG